MYLFNHAFVYENTNHRKPITECSAGKFKTLHYRDITYSIMK